jgi:two-component system heavy metal sensor histidine kinase CusS
MRSNRTNGRSISAQLVLLFTLASSVLLGCALGGLYWLVVRHAFAEDNAVLADKMRALRSELREPDGLKAVVQEVTTPRTGKPAIYWIRVLDPSSAIRAETPGMREIVPVASFAQPNGGTSANPRNDRIADRLFSLVTSEQHLPDGVYTIQLAQDRSEDERFHRTFGALLLVTLVVGTLAFAAIAVLVSRAGLRPLREMTDTLGRIGPGQLNKRLGQHSWPREIQPLAMAFDDMLARLEESFVRLSQFSANLAHELRTPVANLLGEAQVALSRERAPLEYREIIESNVMECERLSGIIDNLLFLARAEAAEENIQRTTFNAANAVAKIIALYETVAEEQRIKIYRTGAGEIYADPILFERAINNVIENAVRYTSPEGLIEVSIRASATHCQVEVKDNGCGIADEHQPHIFDRFYRADRSRHSTGTGLGLSIVKSIMDLHKGSVAIVSQPAKGTTLTLTFPNKPVPEA